MKELIYHSSLGLHIVSGFIALFFGAIAMLVRKKGGKLHNISGLLFFYGMLLVFVTTFLFFLLEPSNPTYHFFLGLNFVAFYPAFSGYRVLRLKKGNTHTWLDKVGAIAVFLAGIAMVLYAIYIPTELVALFWVFGVTGLINGFTDAKQMLGKRIPSNRILPHIGKMMGGYSAAVTAFAVNVLPKYLPNETPFLVFIAMWVAPGVIFGILSAFEIRKFRKKTSFKAKTVNREIPVAASM